MKHKKKYCELLEKLSLKIVIADKSIKNMKFIINRIINNVEKINIKSYVATTEEVVLRIVSENEINVILLILI